MTGLSCKMLSQVREEEEDEDDKDNVDVGKEPIAVVGPPPLHLLDKDKDHNTEMSCYSDADDNDDNDTPKVSGVLYSRSIRSHFATLVLQPLSIPPSGREPLKEEEDDEDDDDDEIDPIMIRINFGDPHRPLTQFTSSTTGNDSDNNESNDNNDNNNTNTTNLVPFWRSHVRRCCKLGDLIQISGGDFEKESSTTASENNTTGWQQRVQRYILTLHSTLSEADRHILVRQPRCWTIPQVQRWQAKYVAPSPPVVKSNKLSSSDSNSQHENSTTNHPQLPPTSNNTSLAKRHQASCCANFLLHAIFDTLVSQNEHNGPTCSLEHWPVRPVRDLEAVQHVLSTGPVLDVAGGSGYLAMALGLRGLRATVLDPRRYVGKLPKRDRKIFARAATIDHAKRPRQAWHSLWFPTANHGTTTREEEGRESPEPQESTEDLSMYYCQPVVQPFDSYRAWFGSLPQQMKDSKVKEEDADQLPVCNETNPLLQQASAIVALHPDEATDFIVDLAVAMQIPFVVVPCCVHSRNFPNRHLVREGHDGTVRTLSDLLDYLQAKHPSIQRSTLPFDGSNTVLWSTFGLERYNKNRSSTIAVA